MTATVEQTKSDLLGLIRIAVGGEDVVITDGGKPIAKLTGVEPAGRQENRGDWLKSLRDLRDATATEKAGRSSDEILREDRAERD